MTERLALRSLTKLYGTIPAVKDITFSVRPGVVHALIGENGAGKSTLVKLITGMESPNSGEILLDGIPCAFSTPIDARYSGVTAVYQNPKLFPHLDVAENIFMGIYPRNALGLIDKKRMYNEASEMLHEVGVDIDPHSYLSERSIAEVHFIEIVRAMCENLRLLLLDEPTATLTSTEADAFFAIVQSLTSRGVSVIFISHRLNEIRRMADDITILRDGEHIVTTRASDLTADDIVHYMVGRDIATTCIRSIAPVTKRPILEVRGLGLPGYFDDINFSIHGGEIVGLAGLVGAGRTEIAEAIFGIRPPATGTVVVDGVEAHPRSPEEMATLGIAYLPENRDAHGLAISMAITSNICMAALGRLSPDGLIRHSSEIAFAQSYASDFEITYQSLDAPVETLSGGNRQKVVLAKWLAALPKVFILDEPTQGIDISTRALVHQRIAEIASAGYPILIISSDVHELLAMCDRILVINRGRITACFDRDDATQDSIIGAAVKGCACVTRRKLHVERGEMNGK